MSFDKKAYMKDYNKKYYHNKKKWHKARYQKWRKENPELVKQIEKDWYEKNKDYKQTYSRNRQRKVLAKLRKDAPWKLTFQSIKRRCENKYNNRFYCYGARGIKCEITVEELKSLWFRDKAYLMKMPSIDRINNDGNYVLSNCRYIEKSENSKKGSH